MDYKTELINEVKCQFDLLKLRHERELQELHDKREEYVSMSNLMAERIWLKRWINYDINIPFRKSMGQPKLKVTTNTVQYIEWKKNLHRFHELNKILNISEFC